MPGVRPPASCNVYTPTVLADAIVSSLGDNPDARWMEPCVGKGAFLAALAKHGVSPNRITGIDLSSVKETTDRLARVKRSTEFLAWAAKTHSRFDRIVANPPFISLSDVEPDIQAAARRHETPDGVAVSLGSNCWYAFLCASLRLLKPGGSIAFVLPAAFEYANYAEQLRKQFLTLFGRSEIHRSRRPLFEPVDEGSVVVIGRDYQSPPRFAIRRVHEGLHELAIGMSHRPELPQKTVFSKPASDVPLIALQRIMSIGIGAVTGHADYFLMNEDQRIRLDLPVSAMRPVVSKAKQVQVANLTRQDWDVLRDCGERIWLFRPTKASLQFASVKRYLKTKPEDGGCQRDAYKIRNRAPWYLTPLPPPPHGFLSGMSKSGPVICFNEMRSLSTTNTLYTVRFAVKLSPHQRQAWALMLLTTEARRQLQACQREYALGLKKFEPGDIAGLMLPEPQKTRVSWATYQSAVKAAIAGDIEESTRIADKHVARS